MTEGSDDAGEAGPAARGTERRTWDRVTAPQQAYSARDVGIGIVVAAISLVITFAVPLAFTV